MQFYVPFTVRHPVVEAAVPPGTVWVDVSGSPDAYWAAMCGWWARGEAFAVVEHDVLIRPDVVEQFASCPEPWCAFGYDNICHPECMEAWANVLGCTRFSAEIIAAVPDAVRSVAPELRDWHNLCDSLGGDKVGGMPSPLRPGSLRHAGFTHHWHGPPVHHISWEGHQR